MKNNVSLKNIVKDIAFYFVCAFLMVGIFYVFVQMYRNHQPFSTTNFTISYVGVENPTSYDLKHPNNSIVVDFIDNGGGFSSLPVDKDCIFRGDEDMVQYLYYCGDVYVVNLTISEKTANLLGFQDWYKQANSDTNTNVEISLIVGS